MNDSVGEGEFVTASGGLLIVQSVGATAGPLLGGLAMSAWDHGLAYTLIAAQILLAVFGVYRSTHRAAPRQMHKGRFVVEPLIPVGTSLESRAGRSGRIRDKSYKLIVNQSSWRSHASYPAALKAACS